MAQESERRTDQPAPKAKNVGGRPKKARTDRGLVEAIDKAGGIGNLAVIAGVTTGAVSIWHRVPEKAVDAISAQLNIPRHTLRPDLYDPAGVRITKS